MKDLLRLFLFITIISSCKSNHTEKKTAIQDNLDNEKIYTKSSQLENTYENFNSPKAINHIAKIENEYFNNYEHGLSKYYGTEWKSSAINEFNYGDTISVFNKYKNELVNKNITPDSMHCTIYAIEALKAGMDSSFYKLDEFHRQIWNEREYAGWSVAHILTKHFNWKAYLILSKDSHEYEKCLNSYNTRKEYSVWKQPNIKIEQLLDFENEKTKIDSLLSLNEFGWGFSDQGWHTWITRFNVLKECNWIGVPSKNIDSNILFKSTKFTDYYDYGSHIVVFPPKKKQTTANSG